MRYSVDDKYVESFVESRNHIARRKRNALSGYGIETS